MIHPLLRLVVTQPKLIAEHAEAYVGLVSEEAARTAKSYAMRAGAAAVGLVLAILFLVFAGVAVMLWAATPAGALHAPWALFVVPGLPLLVAIACLLYAKKETESPFAELKEQVAADLSMIRQASAAT